MPWNFPAGIMVNDSRSLALRVHLPASDVTRTIIFDAQMTVGQACEHIQAQLRESDHMDHVKDYGLFLPHEDDKKGLWLENSRTLEHYILRNGDTVEYKNRYRWLYIRTMDGTRKTLRVDDSKSVAELMLLICTKMGIYNHEEYSLVHEHTESERESRTGTLRKSGGIGGGQTGAGGVGGVGTLGRDQEKMERLKRKLHTDDDMDWLNPAQSLRQQGIDEKEVLLLKRRYFFSDMNIDSRDPIQLNLLYVQLKDAILKGTHPVSQEEAVYLGGIQCQVQFGDYYQERFQHNILDLKEFLPKEYAKLRNLSKKILHQHSELRGLSEVEAKSKYCQFCRSLKTYGITFFLVKERIKGKNKLIPRLLGVTKDSVVRLDEKTKEVLKIWPLTSISRWAASLHAFTMDFGEYSPDDCYTAQTSEGEQISQLIAGYVDIITRKQKAKDHPGIQGDEESAMYEENVRAERATIVQHKPARQVEQINGVIQNNHDQLDTIPYRHENSLQVGPPDSELDGMATAGTFQFIHGASTVVDGHSVHTTTGDVGRIRQMSPDNFMIGGTHIFYYQQLTPAQRALLVTIDDDIQQLKVAKEQLYIDPVDDRTIFALGSDETSRRWLSESMGASQAKVTDEVGAMNAAVAQALRSANHAENLETDGGYHYRLGVNSNSGICAPGSSAYDPGDDLMTMQQSFRVVTIHFPAFVDDVKRVAVLRREAGTMRADEMMMAGSTEAPAVAMMHEAEQSSHDLISAARNVADAFTDLLESARPVASRQTHEEVIDGRDDGGDQHATGGTTVLTSSRKAIIEAAGRVGEASNDLLRHVMRETGDTHLVTEEEHLYQDQLLYLAKAVANATAGLVVKTKNLATQPCLEPEAQQRVIAAATQTGLCTSQLVACTKVLAPTIHQPSCQQQLCEAAREVTWAVDGVVQASRAAGLTSAVSTGVEPNQERRQQQALQVAVTETETAATEVRDALDQLNAHLLRASPRAFQDDALENFQTAYADLQQFHTNDGQRMVAAARRLAQATAQMIADIKAQGELAGDDPERQARLFNAAKQLADATTVLINAAKVCSGNPDNLRYQDDLREAADRLNQITQSAMAEPMQTRLIRSLQSAVRATVTGATQLVNVIQVAIGQARGSTHQVQSDAKLVDSLIPRTVISIRDSRANPEDPMTQLELILTSERFLQPCEALIRSSRSIAPTVSDARLQSVLDQSNNQLTVNVEILLQCLARLAPLTRHLQIDGALARLSRLINEAADIESSLEQGILIPLPDEKPEDCYRFLSLSVNDATTSAQNLHSLIQALARQESNAVSQPDVCGPPAVSLASSIAGLAQATRGVVANDAASEHQQQRQQEKSSYPAVMASLSARSEMTQDMRRAVQLAYELVRAASTIQNLAIATASPQVPSLLNTMLNDSNKVASELHVTLERCLRGLPGQREITEAIHLIETRRNQLADLAQSAPTHPVRFVEAPQYERTQTDLTQAAVEFNQATGDLLASYSPGTFRRSSRRFTGAFDQLTDKGIELSTTAVQQEAPPRVHQELVNGLVRVSDHSYVLMQEAGRVCARPAESDLRSRFQAAARGVTESVSQLLTDCTNGAHSGSQQRDCEAAIRRLEAMRPLLENPVRPVNQLTYYDCVDAVAKSLAPLIESLRSMSSSAKEKKGNEFTSAVHQCADSFCDIVGDTAQAAYLIGAADTRTGSTQASPVDTQLFLRTHREIQDVCEAICDPKVTDQQVISLATEMARSGKILCEACSTLVTRAPQPEARRQLTNLTQETMQTLTTMIQQLSQARTVLRDRQVTLVNARAVGSSVSRLVQLVTGPSTAMQFNVTTPVDVSPDVKESQRPVNSAGLTSLSAAQNVLKAAHSLFVNAQTSKGDDAYLLFSTASKELSENIKVLAVSMREYAPGQLDCQRALANIARLLRDLQQAKITSMEDRIQPRRELSEEGFQKQLYTSVRAVADVIPAVGHAARSDSEKLGHSVRQLDSYLPGLTESAIAAASRSPLSSTQLAYLEHASAIVEAADQLLTVAKEAGGNTRAVHLHPSIEGAVRGSIKSCEDLLAALNDISSQQGHVSTLIDSINRAIKQTEEIVQVPVDARFSEYQARLLRITRHMEQLNQGIQLRARQPTSPDAELTPLARMLTQEYQEMCQTCKEATATLPDVGQADQLRVAVQRVGYACSDLVKATASGTRNEITTSVPDSEASGQQQMWMLSRNRAIAELDRRAELHSARLHDLIAIVNAHGPGTQACLQSASTVSGIIADLDTTILFASSGTLHGPIHDDVDALSAGDVYRQGALPDSYRHLAIRSGESGPPMESFEPIRESIVRTARALVDDTQSLVSGTGEDQTRLASTAHIAVERVTQLADVVKRGATILGPGQPDTQVDLLRACRDAASSMKTVFLSATKLDSRPPGDPVREEACSNVQVTISRIGTLIQKANAVEADDLRGIQALILAIKHCHEQAAQLTEPQSALTSHHPHGLATPLSSCRSTTGMSATNVSAFSGSSSLVARYLAPDDLARVAGTPVQSAVSKVMLTSRTRSQQDIIATATNTRDVVCDIVTAAKALLRYTEAPAEKRNECIVTAAKLAGEFAELLDALKTLLYSNSKNAGDRDRVDSSARRIAGLSHRLLSMLDDLREGPRLIMYFRASSPEWRDVAEKFIGRHVAYHHHYVPNYSISATPAVTHSSVFVRPTCYPLPSAPGYTTNCGTVTEAEDEVEKRIDAAINQLELSLHQQQQASSNVGAPLLQSTHVVAVAIKDLIQTARSMGLTLIPSKPVDRVRHGSRSSAALWRAELTVSLATQQMCELSQLCSEAMTTAITSPRSHYSYASGRLVPVRERLLGAVHQVASACAQLLLYVKSKKLTCVTADIKKLQMAGQAVKESTDRLFSTVHHSQFYSDAADIVASAELPVSIKNATDTMTEIHTRQSELAALRQQLDHLEQEQLRAHPALFGGDCNTGAPTATIR